MIKREGWWSEHPMFELLWPFIIIVPVGIFYIYQKRKHSKGVLDPKIWLQFPLIEKKYISPNTSLYRFQLPNPDDKLGLPIGQHISVKCQVNGQDVMRSYTPTTLDDEHGHFDLVVKTYPQGNVSRMFADLKIGDKINVRGPKGNFKYQPNMVSHLTMICGGTGITPMYQVAKAILKNRSQDRTKISMIFANVNEEDILLRRELNEFAEKYSTRFSIYYVLNNAPQGWTGGVGFVTKEMIADRTPDPKNSRDLKILLCGPPPMIKAMTMHCEELGYDKAQSISKAEDMIFKF